VVERIVRTQEKERKLKDIKRFGSEFNVAKLT
jgi:hypothetical protein